MIILSELYVNFVNLFNILLDATKTLSDSGLAYIGAGIAVFTGSGTGIGQGLVGMKAVEGVSRQPEATGKIMTFMIVAQVVVETTAIYGLIIAFILIGK